VRALAVLAGNVNRQFSRPQIFSAVQKTQTFCGFRAFPSSITMLSAKFDLSTVPVTRADATYTGGSSAIPITATTPTYDQILRFCDLGDDVTGLAQGSAAHRFSAEQRAIIQFIRRIVTGPPSAVLISEARRLVPKQSPSTSAVPLAGETFNYTGGLTTLWNMNTAAAPWAPTVGPPEVPPVGMMINISSIFGYDGYYFQETDPVGYPDSTLWTDAGVTTKPPQRFSVNDATGIFAVTDVSVYDSTTYFPVAKDEISGQRGIAFVVPSGFVTSVSGKVTIALAARHSLAMPGSHDPYGREEEHILCVASDSVVDFRDLTIQNLAPDYVTADIPTLAVDVIVAKVDQTNTQPDEGADILPAAKTDLLSATAETTDHAVVIGQARIMVPTAASLFTAGEYDVHFTVPVNSGGTAYGVFLRMLPSANQVTGDFSERRNHLVIDARASLRIG
jgi:hypothetical protein